MKSDIYTFDRVVDNIDDITAIVSKAAAYNRLGHKQELKLLLLSEELVGMLPNLLMCGKGKFWIENIGNKYELHAVVAADDLLSKADREEILSVSKSGKNEAAVGIVNKIKIAAEMMFANYALSVGAAGDVELGFDQNADEIYRMGAYEDPMGYTDQWSLVNYKKKTKVDTAEWDELEKSIIANMADDVTVGIINSKVEITVKKTLSDT